MHYHTVAFTTLELKGLWVRATGGSTAGDRELDQSAEDAVEKVYRAEKGMTRRGQNLNPKRGPDLTL